MSPKKCCCCGLLSCFPCFAPITNPSRPAATHTVVESSHQLSSSAPPSAVASSQVNASTDGTVMQNAPSVHVDGDLSDLINYISELFRFIEEKVQKKGNNQSKPKGTKNYWPHSSIFSRLKEVFSETIEGIKEVPTGDAKTIAQEFVKGAGKLHMATAGFLVVAYVLERYEAISTNEGTCLSILKEMEKLARHVNQLRKRPKLKEGMDDSIREAIALIVEASIACCTQINANFFSKFFSTRVDGEELSKFQERLTKLDTHMQENFNLCLYDAIVRLRKPIELQYPEHPSHAVGIEDPLKKVIKLLEMGSDKKAVAVILHGVGGMGKTTLADAVFVRLLNADIEGCRYSYVRLFDNMTSDPKVAELQKFIIKALKMGEEPKDFQRYEEGRLQIKSILEKEMVFIYIDNVLRPDALEWLLPKKMGKYARKLRLLLTARDERTVKISGVETKSHLIEGLHEAEALELLNNTLDDDPKEQLDPFHLKKMVQICGGVPQLLDVVAEFINTHRKTALQAYNTVLLESQENWKGEVGNGIESYVFASDKLEDKLKKVIELQGCGSDKNVAAVTLGNDIESYVFSSYKLEDSLKEVIERLEMGSDKNAVAVILHGFGGMGKTTLADAVFERLQNADIEGCRYSYVRLFDDITSVPDVVKLQKFIIKALKMGEEPTEFQRYEEGQLQIKSILEKEMVFIYIDNVLRPDALEWLLPKKMGKYAKKLRLLLTARDKEAVKISGVETKFYRIEGLHAAEALELLKNTLDDDRKKQLNPSHLNQIVEICRGVPKLLDVVAGFINNHGENALQAYNTVLEESQENWKGEVGNGIESYVFAYDKLEDNLKYPFLDICSYFQGWDWKVVADIVGNSDLEKLEKRALVTRDVKTMTARVHDVILEVGLKKTKGERLRLTSATEIEDFLDIEDEDLKNIKGIWASYNKDPLRIPAKKLDLMSGSLRVLKLGPLSTVVEGKCEKKFNELVFFSAEISHLPFDVSKFNKLAHLCYHPEDLQNLSQMPSSLRHIEFELNSPAFEISSNCIKRLSNLRVLSLENAPLKRLPQEIGNLGNGRLEELELSNCQYLEDLPASISGLVSLRVLRMGGCSGLRQLPEDLGSLNSLQELYLYGCKSLETLPRNLESLTSLKELDLSWCESLKELPGNLGRLTSLQELHLDKCLSLGALPRSLEELSLLTILNLNECDRIKDLPCGLAKLTSLAELNLYGCSQLSTIPEGIGQLKLNSINLASSILKGLPDGFCKFSTLTELDMTDCSFLEKLPERFGDITSLRKLRLVFCVSLKKLPESFSQLKNLELLDLSNCSTLEELCKDFKGLSSLRVLSLEFCEMLKKLPEDFHCLTSLEVLDVTCCGELEGKWIDSLVNMKTLQILRIEGCWLLEERWEEIRGQSNQSWSCTVDIGQDLSNEENLLQQFQSKFDSMLTNGEGKPLNISGRPLNTLLLVMFDGEEEFHPGFPWRLLEENIDDIKINLEMVYFGNHWDQLPKKVANRILGHAPANRDVKALFQKLLSLVDYDQTDFEWQVTSRFQMSAEIVSGENGDRYLSRWEHFSEMGVENFVVTKCERYRKLKQLAGEELLRELFASGEKESSLSFFKKGAVTKVRVDELQGKTILLDIRPANVCRDIPLQSLVEMYDVEKERSNFEIITVPIMQKSTKEDVSDKFSREVPWLVLQNPWQLTNATKYFLVEGCVGWPGGWERWYPNVMRIIKSDGTMAAYNNPGVLRMVNAWGAAAYPFTAAEAEKLIQKEKTEMEAVSHAMFLFRHLERVSEQLRKATGQQKMICLCCCDEKDFTNSMKDVLTELSDIIYIIYIPNFTGAEESKLGYFTATIYECYSTLKTSKMSSAEMQRMFSLSLSEHEAMRFWARMYSLRNVIDARDDQIQLRKIISRMTDFDRYSGMFIMNEDGNLITTEGKEIVKLLSEKYSDDGRVKELMQQLLKGTQTNWQKTLLELEECYRLMVKESWKNAID